LSERILKVLMNTKSYNGIEREEGKFGEKRENM
jgi:hypothetical protein